MEILFKEVGESKVAKFSLATSENYKNKQGEKVTNTEWHTVVIWGKLAEVVEKFVEKGDKLYLEGKIAYKKYEKDNETKYFTEINVNELKMLTPKGQSEQPSEQPSQEQGDQSGGEDNDDLPF